MKLPFQETDPELTQLLKQSRVDFKLDQQAGKNRLLQTIAHMDNQTIPITRVSHGFIFKFGIGLAGVVLVVSATFGAAATAVPGDKLFALNKLGAQFILSLPLSAQTNAQVRASIVENRFRALDEISTPVPDENSLNNDTRRLETIKESEESLTNAVDTISAKQQDFENSGEQAQALALEKVLNNLAQNAATHEQRIEALATQAQDDQERTEINSHLSQFRKARQKAESGNQSND